MEARQIKSKKETSDDRVDNICKGDKPAGKAGEDWERESRLLGCV